MPPKRGKQSKKKELVTEDTEAAPDVQEPADEETRRSESPDLDDLPALPDISIGPISTFSYNDATKSQALIPKITDAALTYNPTYEDLTRAFLGPENPNGQVSVRRKNIITGYAEEQAFNDAVFNVQHRTFQSLGYARDPTEHTDKFGKYAGDVETAIANEGKDVLDIRPSKHQLKDLKRKRQGKGDVSILDGPDAYKGPWASYADPNAVSSSSGEEEEELNELENLSAAVVESSQIEPRSTVKAETSKFHGSQLHDYLGRTYMHVPRDLDIDLDKDPGVQESYLPKRRIFTWAGHQGGVTALRFFPRHGHLLLSSGADNKVKLWDCYHDRELLRSFSGHLSTVKDISFTNDGTKFLSASYDRTVKLWDTETGQCISRFSNSGIANCVKFNPDPDKQDQFVIGTSNKKIVQYDINSGEVVQEYDHHVGAVNSITFVDENRRFMTTSDDKSIRVWEWQINVPIKFIADPQQHSMPTVALHPSGRYVAAQSLDNQILVFGATDKFRQNRKKSFRGNNCAGYAIGLDFTSDGQYLMSGDSGGYACFWNWKTTQMKVKFKAHDRALTCIAAHPQETSRVATAGLDGKIKYWD
ncbi:WD40-repeat-containing domain protein [Lipomyces japonicus]|uniref:WD40-repeat-containing domain protein n=1 Tax=Lipomyces japonicus TaxID=56871 RepID=UPI0034CEE880